jgi:catechol 2,3-dioxygenase-like lactoylglutathione lyase family enzyme
MKQLNRISVVLLVIAALFPMAALALGIPSATNVDHVDVAVPNLNQAITFYVEIIGCDLVYRPSLTHSAMMRCGPVTNIQLTESNSKDTNSFGGFSIYVSDIAGAVKYLRSKRVEFVEDPTPYTNEYVSQKKVTFLTPWKSRMELLTYSRPQPYEKTTTARTYGPAPDWVNH